jgi:hypothetical protein
MVDFRKWFPALAVVAVVLGSAGSAKAQAPFGCQSNFGATPSLRAEGLSELVGDVVLNCTGGTPTAAGATVPQANIQIILNTNITSRLVADPLSEALILIDDPAPGQQVACVPANYTVPTGLTPSSTTCPIAGVGTSGNGVNFKTSGVPNVFQARNAGGNGNALLWLGVPIDPPGSTGTRTIRITNVRANASQLGTSSTLIPTQVQMFLNITPFQALPVNNPQQTVGFVQPGLSFSLRRATDVTTTITGVTFLQCTDNNASIAGNPASALNGTLNDLGRNNVSFFGRFTEGFPSSFKRRDVFVQGTGLPPQDSPGGICPTCVGGQYFTETGFYNPNLPSANGLNRAGLADFGTRLALRFANVPAGAQIFVGISDTGGRAALISTDTGALTSAAGFSTITGTNAGNAGGATPPQPTLAPVAITGGVGTAVYEIFTSNPLNSESFDIPIAVAYVSNTSTSTPGLGTATVSGSFAPISTVITQSASAPIPRFADNPIARTAFTVNACSTNLLFPFVTNQAGFDTGIAIANTSLDPFGTKTQQGTCDINYYGNSTGGGAAPPKVTSPVVPAGTELVFLVSSGGGGVAATPGFQGYIIASCAFQYAHGFAFISDLGSQKLAEGYIALVLDSGIVSRTGTSSELAGR